MANRHYHFKFNVEKDATYIQRLDAQENMQNYIRRLILSDIAADGLRDLIQLAPEDEKPDQDQDQDPDEVYYIARQNFYASHCPAIGDREASCKGCLYFKPEEYGGSCDIEDEFKYQWIRAREHGGSDE